MKIHGHTQMQIRECMYVLFSYGHSHIPLLSDSTVDRWLHFHMTGHCADKYCSIAHWTGLSTEAYSATELSPRNFNSFIWHFYLLTHLQCGIFDDSDHKAQKHKRKHAVSLKK